MFARKLLVITLVGAVIGVSCIWTLAQWLTDTGAVDAAISIRKEFLTGTAVTVIIALLILLPDSRRKGEWPFD